MASILSAVAQGVSGLISFSQSNAVETPAVKPGEMTINDQIMDIDDADALPEQPVAGPSQLPTVELFERSLSMPADLNSIGKTRFGYVYDVRMLLHSPLEYHPEAPARIIGIHDKLREAGCLNRMKMIPIRKVTKLEALLVHSEDHWDKVQMIARQFTVPLQILGL